MSLFPERYVVFDTESNDDKVDGEVPTRQLTLRLGVALVVDTRARGAGRETWNYFRTAGEFHDVLSAIRRGPDPVFVFAHTIGFDVRMVAWWWWMGQGRYTLTHPKAHVSKGYAPKVRYVTDAPPFIVVLYRPDGQKFILLDTCQWINRSLRTIGQWIGVPKGVMPLPDAPEDDWWDYCRQDVVVLRAALERLWAFVGSFGPPTWCYTAASQSALFFRMRQGRGVVVRPEDPAVLKLDRLSYYGGLAEAFRLGRIEGPLYQVDVSSLYPSVMREAKYPVEWLEGGDHSGLSGMPGDFTLRNMTAEVWLDTPVHPFPVRGDDQTMWCTGKVRTILCGPELERAYCLGIIKQVGRWSRYRLDEPFTEFVDYWWAQRMAMRKAGRQLEESVCKSILISLYGKFGQRADNWEDTGIRTDPGDFGAGVTVTTDPGRHLFWRIMKGVEYKSDRDAEDPRGFVPIAAWTASYGRCRMWDMIHTAGIDHVMHIATDSLIVDERGLRALEDAELVADGVMGKFRVDSVATECHIYGTYSMDWGEKIVRPGIKRDAVPIGNDLYAVEKWSEFQPDMNRGRFDSVTIETWFLSTARRFKRREVAQDGSTRPWSIDNWHLTPEEQSRMPVR